MDRGHPLPKIGGHVTKGVKLGVARLPACVEMRELGDRTTAENADPQSSVVLLHETRASGA